MWRLELEVQLTLIWVPSVLSKRLLPLAAHQPSVPNMAGVRNVAAELPLIVET